VSEELRLIKEVSPSREASRGVDLAHLKQEPGAEVEEILESQGETITDIVGKEGWVANDPKLYEGLIPQNCEWTEFVDEKTGEWVYLDEYGQRVKKA
jgi:hypothetical protein